MALPLDQRSWEYKFTNCQWDVACRWTDEQCRYAHGPDDKHEHYEPYVKLPPNSPGTANMAEDICERFADALSSLG